MANFFKTRLGENWRQEIVQRKSPRFSRDDEADETKMDISLFFENQGYSLVADQILKHLDYDTIKTCRQVSKVWKKYIDGQKTWRLDHLFSLEYRWESIPCPGCGGCDFGHCRCYEFLDYFDEWRKLYPYIRTQMSISDIDKLIKGVTRYMGIGEGIDTDEEFEEELSNWDYDLGLDGCIGEDENNFWCPLRWAIHEGNFEFVEMMIRTPFDFNTLRFQMKNLDYYRAIESVVKFNGPRVHFYLGVHHADYDRSYFDLLSCEDNTVLHKAAQRGHIKIVKLLIKHADEKKIDLNAKNTVAYGYSGQTAIETAKDDPEIIKLLLKHSTCDSSTCGNLGPNTIAEMHRYYHESHKINHDDKPKKKKRKLKHDISSKE